jgi:hypothetical protein
MAALLVFESMYGSTAAVAQAIAAGLADVRVAATVCEVGLAAGPDVTASSGLLIIGAPTHQRGLSTPHTRDAARGDATATVTTGDGVREWLELLAGQVAGRQIAVFDTAVKSRLSGSAANAIARRLTKAGAQLAVPPESFVVSGRSSGLAPDELERAQSWGRGLALFATAAAARA